MKLTRINLGEVDGREESKSQTFNKLFYNHAGIVDKVIEDNKIYLILGGKGTGKSILGHYLEHISKQKYDLFCCMSSYGDLYFKKCISTNGEEYSEYEYIALWKWVLLIELAKVFIQNTEVLETSADLEDLLNFIKENYGKSISRLSSKKILEKTIKKKTGLKLGFLSGEQESVGTYEDVEYFDYLDDLEDKVISVLEDSMDLCPEIKYVLVIDELDDNFKSSEGYKKSVVSLLYAAQKLNRSFFDNGVFCKVVLLLRSDIFRVLGGANLNKIRESSSLSLDWNSKIDNDIPLMRMVTQKIGASLFSETKRVDKSEHLSILQRFFPKEIPMGNKNILFANFLLERTRFRPRDIVAYLKKAISRAIEKKPDSDSLEEDDIRSVDNDYSRYFLGEFKDELEGHYRTEVIDEIIKMFGTFGRRRFYFEEIDNFCKKNNLLQKYNLENLLEHLFLLGFIGQYSTSSNWCTWAYRESFPIFNKNDKMELHLGLKSILRIRKRY